MWIKHFRKFCFNCKQANILFSPFFVYRIMQNIWNSHRDYTNPIYLYQLFVIRLISFVIDEIQFCMNKLQIVLTHLELNFFEKGFGCNSLGSIETLVFGQLGCIRFTHKMKVCSLLVYKIIFGFWGLWYHFNSTEYSSIIGSIEIQRGNFYF